MNLPALTDGASDPSARLELHNIAVLMPPRPTSLVLRDWLMIGLVFARSPGFLPSRPGSGHYSELQPCGVPPYGVSHVGLLTSVRQPGDT